MWQPIIEIAIILFLVYNFRAIWSIAKFRPERSFGYKWEWFYGKDDENHWLFVHYPQLFAKYCNSKDKFEITNTLDAFHIFQGAMNYVFINGLLLVSYGLITSLWITPIVFILLESMFFNPLFHSVYTRKGYRDLYRSSPWKYILRKGVKRNVGI